MFRQNKAGGSIIPRDNDCSFVGTRLETKNKKYYFVEVLLGRRNSSFMSK